MCKAKIYGFVDKRWRPISFTLCFLCKISWYISETWIMSHDTEFVFWPSFSFSIENVKFIWLKNKFLFVLFEIFTIRNCWKTNYITLKKGKTFKIWMDTFFQIQLTFLLLKILYQNSKKIDLTQTDFLLEFVLFSV